MTINLSENTPRISYTVAAGATQQTFTIPFEFYVDANIKVYVDGTLKTLTTDYTITGGDGTTGSVVFKTAGSGETQQVLGASGGSTVTIVRSIALSRTTDFPVSGAFQITSLNTELDRFVAISSEISDKTNRSLHLSDYDTGTLELPSSSSRANKMLAFDASGNVTTGQPVVPYSAAEVRALVESATDSNVFTDADHTKLNSTNIFTDSDHSKLDAIEANATADQTNAEIRAAIEAASDSNVFTDADHSKLNGVEANATADQTAAEIRTLVESASDSNVFTDADHSKLNAIEASADVTDTANVVAALSAGTGVGISNSGEISVTSVALVTVQTANSQSAHLALTAQEGDVVVRSDENKSYMHNGGTAGSMSDYTLLATPTDAVLSVNGNTGAISAAQIATAVEAASNSNTFTDADHSKLNAIEANATADQTAAEIRTLVESATDSNVFTDADHSKLNAIEASATADQTAAEIKTLYESNANTNAFDDAEQTKLAGIEAGAEVNIGSYFMISANSQGIANGEIITTHPNASGQTSEVIDFTGVGATTVARSGNNLTFTSANTTYSFADSNGTVTITPSSGSAVTLVIGTAAGSGGLAMRGNAGGADSVALGTSSNAIGVNAITIGKSATTSTGTNSPTNGIAIGEQAHSYGGGTTALGSQASVEVGADNSIALGSYASVPTNYYNSVALGTSATVTAANQIMLGTSNKTVKIPGALDVTGNATFSDLVTADPESGNFSSTYNNYDGVGLFIKGNGTSGNGNYGPALVFGSCDSDTANQDHKHSAISVVQTDTDPNQTGLAFWTHPSVTSTDALFEAMRIDASGRVGIANINPSYTLEVGDALGIYDDNTSAVVAANTGHDLELRSRSSQNVRIVSGGTERMRISPNGDISFYDDSNNAKFFWDASAESLGIGTILPSASYSIDTAKGIRSSGAAPNFTLQETDASNQTWLMGSYGGSFAIRDTTVAGTSYPFKIEAAAPSNTLYLNTSGNVGIGTINPIADLSIVDSSTGSGIEIQPEVTTNTNRITNYDRVESAYKKFRLDASEQQFYISGSPKMTLDSSGNAIFTKSGGA